jgi:hypothetical protein
MGITQMTDTQEYIFHGIYCDKATFDKWSKQLNSGTCPFCDRTGLTGKYGSKVKHVRGCRVRKAVIGMHETAVEMAEMQGVK